MRKILLRGIRRQVAHRPAEQVVLRCQEYLEWPEPGQFPPRYTGRSTSRKYGLVTSSPDDSAIQYFTHQGGFSRTPSRRIYCALHMPASSREGSSRSQARRDRRIDVDLLLLWDALLFHAEVISRMEGAHIILRANLDLCSVLLVVILPAEEGKPIRMGKFLIFVTFAEVERAGQFRLSKAELGIVIHVQTDVYDLRQQIAS